MIGYIKGTVEEIFEDSIYLDHNGLGFRIFIPASFRNALDYGADCKIYTHMNVKEDGITLFGFPDREELELYRLLLSVSGVGPKAAMNILSTMNAQELRMAIYTADANKIAKAPGIGKKTAQKILLELKDSVSLEWEQEGDTELSGLEDADVLSDTVEALMALGYSGSEAMKAAKKALKETESADSGVLLKHALRYL